MATPDVLVARAIANTCLWSGRHAKAVVVFVLLMTVTLGYGVTLITTNVDVADVLPRGNPNTAAAHNLTESFRSTLSQQVTFQIHVDESGLDWARDNAMLDRCTQDNPFYCPEGEKSGSYRLRPDHTNITDEVYIRAMEELGAFIEERTDFNRQASINNIYALINWTIAGGEGRAPMSAFALPPDGGQYAAVDVAVQAAVLDAVDALASPSWNHGAILFMPEANSKTDMRTLGDQIIAARNEYVKAVDAGQTTYTVWGSGNPPLLTVDMPVANSHSSALVEEDLVKLMPIIAAFIIVFLYIAFRNIRTIVISFTALGVGVTWTYGIMGYMGIALNTLNMTIVPLIMGVGIDYAIHMINEFLEHKSAGHSDQEAFKAAGERAGLAMFIATMTTVLGLIVMMVSPSLLMAQLGFLSAVAISAIYIITITFIPAALALVGGTDKMGASFTPSSFMPKLARGVTKTRYVMFIAVLLLSVGAYFSSTQLTQEAFGDPGKNFPADDPVRLEHEQGLRYFYEMPNPDVKANILTFEGPGILAPESIAYMREIENNLRQKERVISDTLRTLPFFIETWQTVKGGAPCAGIVVADGRTGGILDPVLEGITGSGLPCDNAVAFPATEGEIRNEVRTMFESPMAELASVIVNYPVVIENPDKGMAAMTFSVKAASYEEAEEVWFQVWDAVHKANVTFGGAPEGVHVSFVGNTATNYLFVAEQLPWLTYMSVAATIILFILVLVFTRDIKATIVATALAGITSIWWLGILPFINIGLAITLMLPLVFIFNIGTDYAVHIIWSLKKVGNAREVFETTGKAILFSAITTAGAFAVFTAIRNVAVSRTMMATTLSIFVIFAATMLVIPIFYKVAAQHEIEVAKPPVVKATRIKKAKSEDTPSKS